MKNIVETAIAAENFTTLVKAVGAADLMDTLSGQLCLHSLRLLTAHLFLVDSTKACDKLQPNHNREPLIDTIMMH
jgi:hypothetical protein